MKIGKIILGFIIVVGVIICVALYNLDTLIKTGVETVASDVTKTNVTLNQVNVQLVKGRGELMGLEIDNPPGFSSEYVLQMKEVALQVEPESLAEPVIVIKEIRIAGANLIAEQKDLVNSNLQELKKNLHSFNAAQGSVDQPGVSATSKPSYNLRLMVEKFAFVDSSVRIITEKWGERELPLPAIDIQNIGDRQVGLSPDQLIQKLLEPVIAEAKDQMSNYLEQSAKRRLKGKLKEKLEEKLDGKQKETLGKLKDLLSQ